MDNEIEDTYESHIITEQASTALFEPIIEKLDTIALVVSQKRVEPCRNLHALILFKIKGRQNPLALWLLKGRPRVQTLQNVET